MTSESPENPQQVRTAWHSASIRNGSIASPIKSQTALHPAKRPDGYVTVLDLGAWGALYTQGWDRRVVSEGEAAKKTKYLINRQRIYPPLPGNRRDILDAAAPLVQAVPEKYPRSAHANCGHP